MVKQDRPLFGRTFGVQTTGDLFVFFCSAAVSGREGKGRAVVRMVLKHGAPRTRSRPLFCRARCAVFLARFDRRRRRGGTLLITQGVWMVFRKENACLTLVCFRLLGGQGWLVLSPVLSENVFSSDDATAKARGWVQFAAYRVRRISFVPGPCTTFAVQVAALPTLEPRV